MKSTLDTLIANNVKTGTYRFRGVSNFRGVGALAQLHLHAENACHVIPVLLSGNGRFYEIIRVKEPVSRITLSILSDEHSSDSLQIETVTFEPINRIKRYWIYLTVALFTWYRLPKSQRYHHNLFWYTACLNPKQAYKAVQQYRFKYGSISYEEWVNKVDQLSTPEVSLIAKFSKQLKSSPPKLIVDARYASRLMVDATLASIQRGILKPDEVTILVSGSEEYQASNTVDLETLSALLQTLPEHQHLLWLPAGCQLAPHALSWITAALQDQPELSCIYSDHDYLDDQGRRHAPQFKPSWSDEMAFSSGYPGCVLSVQQTSMQLCLQETGDITPYRLMLYAAASRVSNVLHLPGVLWHAVDQLVNRPDVSSDVLQAFLKRQGRDALVSVDHRTGLLRIHDSLPELKPLVSIIVPTRDRLDLLVPCITSLLEKTTYDAYEILILDNQSSQAETLAYFNQIVEDSRVSVVPFDHPFNYAAINNYAATQARGDYLCLLNNDTEVISPDWLSEMVSVVCLQGVGAVGAQLRYPNGRLQHAGDLVGGSGCANHLHGPLAEGDFGYMQRVGMRQDLTAVTAACLLTPKKLYLSLGGLEQKRLKVAFNDVDYCLRVREAGYRVVYTPFAELVHYESESRGADLSPKQRRRGFREAQYMRKRWAAVMMNDPFYNPNLNYYRCDFSLDPAPVVKKPWD